MPLPSKISGVFECHIISDHRLTAGAPSPIFVPHSRLNALPEDELRARGLRILTRSDELGADAFVRENGGRLALYLQGHPEYDENSLLLEFRRDLERWLHGAERPPALPLHYFRAADEERLALGIAAAKMGNSTEIRRLMQDPPAPDAARWPSWSNRLVSNWLSFVAADQPEELRVSPRRQ
jgi:homoserine O-succinyltransferase